MVTLRFTAYGKPQPAGSKRAFVRNGRAIVTDDNAKAKPWQASLRSAATDAMERDRANGGLLLFGGPLAVTMTFYVVRPKGHHGARGLRPSAPEHPTTRPDVLKLARGVEDALTGVVWRDDSQVVVETLAKVYGEPARVEVEVTPLRGKSQT